MTPDSEPPERLDSGRPGQAQVGFPPLHCEVAVADPVWDELLGPAENAEAFVQDLLERAWAVISADAEVYDAVPPAASWSLDVLLCDDAKQRRLNAAYRSTDAPTNVLSFPAADDASGAQAQRMLGDLSLASGTCAREAEEQGKSVRDHTAHLAVHGLLHLLGYDHMDDRDAEIMETLERRILAALGYGDPYADRLLEEA